MDAILVSKENLAKCQNLISSATSITLVNGGELLPFPGHFFPHAINGKETVCTILSLRLLGLLAWSAS